MCMTCTNDASEQNCLNLKLKTWPNQLLGYRQIDNAFHGQV